MLQSSFAAPFVIALAALAACGGEGTGSSRSAATLGGDAGADTGAPSDDAGGTDCPAILIYVPAIVSVVDATTHEPICDATLTTASTTVEITLTGDCRYSVHDRAAGGWSKRDVVASKAGYATATAHDVVEETCGGCPGACPEPDRHTIELQPIVDGK